MGVTIKGLDKALQELNGKTDDVIQAVKTIILETAEGIQLDASNNAVRSIQIVRELGGPFTDLNFSQRIDKIPIEGGFGAKVGINIADSKFEVEAWVEFGTGLSAREILGRPEYSPEITAIARRFYRNGQGTLIGVPYLFPAFFKNTANLVQEIEEEIAKKIK
jgi:hypothetical protein